MKGSKPSVARQHRRAEELKRMLLERRAQLAGEVHERLRQARTEQDGARRGLDGDVAAPADVIDELEYALIQLRSRTLFQIDLALRRLDDGRYGECCACEQEISAARLRVLPFAVRCTDCETAHETRVEDLKRGSVLTSRGRDEAARRWEV